MMFCLCATAFAELLAAQDNATPKPFPELAEQLRNHWIQGDTLFYIAGENIVLRNIATGGEEYIPYGAYEIKSLIVSGNEIALTARSKETFWDDFLSFINFEYYGENDVYSGIICRIDAATCYVAISGNYLIKDFQSFREAYVFAKVEWSDYAFVADWPDGFRSSIMVLRAGKTVAKPPHKIGGIRSVFASSDSVFVDIHIARREEFQTGAGVYRWTGENVSRLSLPALNDKDDETGFNGRYHDFHSGQLRTDGRNWVISDYVSYDGKTVNLNTRGFCGNYFNINKTKTSVFFENGNLVYINDTFQKRIKPCRPS